jgi:hypothetical protein
LIKATLGTTWDNSSSGYKLGVRSTDKTKQKKRESVPRGSTRVGQVNKSLSRGIHLLVHINNHLTI